MPISGELKQIIIDQLKEDRLDFEELAVLHFGDKKYKYKISLIAKEAGLSRKARRGKHNGSSKTKVKSKKSTSNKPIKITPFGPETRLALIDEAITIHKSLLPSVTDSYKMDRWSAGLERLLEQRRMEETPHSDGEKEMLEKIVGALDQHAAIVSQKTSPSISGLPEESSNPDVRLGEERQN